MDSPPSRRRSVAVALLLGLPCFVASCAADPERERYEELARQSVQELRNEQAEEARLLVDPDDGNPAAQYRLARRYELGLDMPVDKVKAVAFYERAAAQKHFDALVRLGLATSGLQVPGLVTDLLPVDHLRAAEYYRRAERLGAETYVPSDTAAYVAVVPWLQQGQHRQEDIRAVIDTLEESPDGVVLPAEQITQRLRERVARGDADAAWRSVVLAPKEHWQEALAEATALRHPFALLLVADDLEQSGRFGEAVGMRLQADRRFEELYGPRSYPWRRAALHQYLAAAGDRPLPVALAELARCFALADGKFEKDLSKARSLFAAALAAGFEPTDADLDAMVPLDVLSAAERAAANSVASERKRLGVLTNFGGRSPAMHRRLADRFLALHARAGAGGADATELEPLLRSGREHRFAAAQIEGWRALDEYGQQCIRDEQFAEAIHAYDVAAALAAAAPDSADRASSLVRQAGYCRVRLGALQLPGLLTRAEAALGKGDFAAAAAAASEADRITRLSVEVGFPLADPIHERIPALLAAIHDGVQQAAEQSIADRFLLARLRAEGLGCVADRAAAIHAFETVAAAPGPLQEVAAVDAELVMLVEWPAGPADRPVPSGWLLEGPDALTDGKTPTTYFLESALVRAAPVMGVLRAGGAAPEALRLAKEALRQDRAAVAHQLDHVRARRAALVAPSEPVADQGDVPNGNTPDLRAYNEYLWTGQAIQQAEEDKRRKAAQTQYEERVVYRYEGIFRDQTITQGRYVSIWSEEDERLHQAVVGPLRSRLREMGPDLPRLRAAKNTYDRAVEQCVTRRSAEWERYRAALAAYERRRSLLQGDEDKTYTLLQQLDELLTAR